MLTYKEKWGKTYTHTAQSMVQRRNYSQHAATDMCRGGYGER